MMNLKPPSQDIMLDKIGKSFKEQIEKQKDMNRSFSNLSINSSSLSTSRISNVSSKMSKRKKSKKSK